MTLNIGWTQVLAIAALVASCAAWLWSCAYNRGWEAAIDYCRQVGRGMEMPRWLLEHEAEEEARDE